MPSVIAKPPGIQVPLTAPHLYAPGCMDSYVESVLSTRTSNLVSYWKLDDSGTTAKDYFGRANGTYIGSPRMLQNGIDGKLGVNFVASSGINIYSLALESIFPFYAGSFLISGYSVFSGGKYFSRLNGAGGAGSFFRIDLNPSGAAYGRITCAIRYGAANTSLTLNNVLFNGLRFVAVTWNANDKIIIYIDGVEVSRVSLVGAGLPLSTLSTTSCLLYCGSTVGAGAFEGVGTGAILWNDILTPQEIWRLGPAALNYRSER